MRRITIIVGGATLDLRARQRGVRASAETFRQPSTAASRTGVFRLSLSPAPLTAEVGGQRVAMVAENGLCTAPALQLDPGGTDGLRPASPGDTQSYERHAPTSQMPGRFSYHSPPRGFSDMQPRNGLSRALVIKGCWIRFSDLASRGSVCVCTGV